MRFTFFVIWVMDERFILKPTSIKIFFVGVVVLVYDRNLVSVSATETKIKFRYRFWCQNFFCLNLNFPPFFLPWFFFSKQFGKHALLKCLVCKSHWYRVNYQLVSCQLTDDWTKKTFNLSCEQPLDTQDDTDI